MTMKSQATPDHRNQSWKMYCHACFFIWYCGLAFSQQTGLPSLV